MFGKVSCPKIEEYIWNEKGKKHKSRRMKYVTGMLVRIKTLKWWYWCDCSGSNKVHENSPNQSLVWWVELKPDSLFTSIRVYKNIDLLLVDFIKIWLSKNFVFSPLTEMCQSFDLMIKFYLTLQHEDQNLSHCCLGAWTLR